VRNPNCRHNYLITHQLSAQLKWTAMLLLVRCCEPGVRAGHPSGSAAASSAVAAQQAAALDNLVRVVQHLAFGSLDKIL
jgi:hypothetical protein